MDKEEKLVKMREDQISRETEYFKRRYRTHMQSLDKSPLARTRSLTEWDYYALGKQLHQFECYKQDIMEADGSVTQLGTLPKLALDAITIGYGASPINAIAGIQPLEEVQGLIYFRQFVAETTRGNVTSQQTLLDSTALPAAFPSGGFTGSAVTAENFISVGGGGTQSFTNVQLGGAAAFMSPINLQFVQIYGTVTFSGGVATFPNMSPDLSTGAFGSAVNVAGTIYGVAGTVDATTGQVSLEFSANPSGDTEMFANYQTVPEAGTDMQKAILKLINKTVTSVDYTLKTTLGLFEAYQLKKRFGIVAEEEAARDLTVVVNNEIMNQAVQLLYANIPGGNSVTWTRQAPTGVSYFEHKMTLKDALTDMAAKLYTSAGRGTVNVLVAGLEACAIMSTFDNFKKLYDDMDFGPHIFGTWDGMTVVRVPYASVLDTNTIIGLYKGKNPYDSPLVWAPYMPLFVTNTLPMGFNPLAQMRAVAVSGAMTSVIPNLSTKLVIDPSGFNYS